MKLFGIFFSGYFMGAKKNNIGKFSDLSCVKSDGC